jgi:membrane-associated phospholipid phosphatase
MDLTISKFLYDSNASFTHLLAEFGQMPGYGIAAFSFAILGFTRNKTKKLNNICGAIFSMILVIYCSNILSRITMPNSVLLFTIIYCIIALLLAFLVKNKNRIQLRYFAIVGIITSLGEFYVIRMIKIFWGRQRFYSILQDDSLFRPWFMPLGKVLDDTYKSFPSGHAGDAAVLICLVNLPWISSYYHKNSTPAVKLFIKLLIYAFIVSVMVSRIIFGAHYLTDVTFGAGITYVIFLISDHIVKRYYKWKRDRLFSKS